jgi:pimeloyl-ACP methyl ester carboxylesterase
MFHQHDHRTIHSVSFGRGANTFVGIAGSFADWTVWSPTFELLQSRWRCVGLDHDGVGLTDVDVGTIDHELHVDTLFSVLDAQGIDRCVVGGHSVNASVAIDAVLRDPGRFNGLVVANGHAWQMDRPEIRAFVDALRTDFDGAVEFFVKLVFPEPGSADEKRWLRGVMHQTGPEACARVLEAKYPVDLRRRLAEVSVPTVVLHGALDKMSSDPLGEATTFESEIPDAVLVNLDDAGHLPLRTRPRAVADVLDAFLDRTTPLLAGTGVHVES